MILSALFNFIVDNVSLQLASDGPSPYPAYSQAYPCFFQFHVGDSLILLHIHIAYQYAVVNERIPVTS